MCHDLVQMYEDEHTRLVKIYQDESLVMIYQDESLVKLYEDESLVKMYEDEHSRYIHHVSR